jgi:hypothetical protein
MNPESPQPGVSSGRKRKGPDTGGSLNAEDSDGSWEDADSSDEDKLKIDEPKKKKVNNSGSVMGKNQDSVQNEQPGSYFRELRNNFSNQNT